MSLRRYPRRLLILAAGSSALLFALCVLVALSLAREQARTADALGEDIESRDAAVDLEATLGNLAELHAGGGRDVEPLVRQARADLAEIARHADKPGEREQGERAAAAFAEYLARRAAGAAPAELADAVRGGALAAARDLHRYNGDELRRSAEEHRRALDRAAGGLAAVGALGSVGGLLLGYGLARGLSRSIQSFLMQVQIASDRLGQEVAAEWGPGGAPPDDHAELLARVEQAVAVLQRQEREVRRAERLAVLGQLAAGVAHEVRNPLTSAILLIEAARRDSAAALTDADLALIEGELHRIEASLQQFLDFARPPEPERGPADLADAARDALTLARGRVESQRVRVALDVPAGGAPLTGDRHQLRQVALNLVLNALDVMPGGGELRVEVRRAGATTSLSVSDTGPGVRADVLPRLFEPFATTKEAGVGLGLAVSRRTAEGHGGTLRGENLPGGGARFTLELPAGP